MSDILKASFLVSKLDKYLDSSSRSLKLERYEINYSQNIWINTVDGVQPWCQRSVLYVLWLMEAGLMGFPTRFLTNECSSCPCFEGKTQGIYIVSVQKSCFSDYRIKRLLHCSLCWKCKHRTRIVVMARFPAEGS